MFARHRNIGANARRISEVAAIRPFIDLRTPDARPGHAGDRKENDEKADENAGDSMGIAPEHPLFRRAAHGHDTAGLFSRPPEIDAGGDKKDGPAGGDFDQIAGIGAEIFQAVEIADRPHDGAAIRQGAGNLSSVGIDVDGPLSIRRIDGDFRRRARIGGGDIFDGCAGNGRKCCTHDLGRQRFRRVLHHFDPLQVWVDEIIELVPEEIKRTGDGERYHEGQDEETGVEMPAPYGAVKICGRGMRRRTLALERGRNGHECLRKRIDFPGGRRVF